MSTWWQKPSTRAQNTHLPRYPSRYHANPLNPDVRFVTIAAAVVLWVAVSLPLTSAQATTTPVGTTLGSFNVANGAASYSIPITVPPGINGIAPSLALTYSSQGGNGLLGMGWGIGGLSGIHRCGATIEQDGFKGGVNYDANDKFCLDGQRLIDIGNGEYRTKRESWKKITASDATTNPGSFTVSSKGGTITEYGETADSRIEAQGTPDARVWALNRVEDRNGNYFTVSYFEDNPNGEYHPDRIDYAGNSVIFLYEDRTDLTSIYEGGSAIRTTKRLTNIQSYAATTLVRDYRLAYGDNGAVGRSRFTSIQECGGDGVCLPATQFGWHSDAAQAPDPANPWPAANALAIDEPCVLVQPGSLQCTDYLQAVAGKRLVGDFDGDGISDVAMFSQWNPSWQGIRGAVAVARGRRDGTFESPVASDVFSNNNQWTDFLTALVFFTVGDVNGDGLDDIVGTGMQPPNLMLVKTAISQGDGTFVELFPGTPGATVVSNASAQTTGDFNGDGILDLASQNSDTNLPNFGTPAFPLKNRGFRTWVSLGRGDGTYDPEVYTAHNSGGMYTYYPYTGDFNGDGLTDVAAISVQSGGYFARVALSQGNGSFGPLIATTLSGADHSTYSIVIGDFNGDGVSDIAATRVNSTSFKGHISLGRGDGTFEPPVTNTPGTGNFSKYEVTVGDFNGDGLGDLVAMKSKHGPFFAHVALSRGDGTLQSASGGHVSDQIVPSRSFNGTTIDQYSYTNLVGDFNGDGVSDGVAVYAELSHPYVWDGADWRTISITGIPHVGQVGALVALGSPAGFDRMTSIQNGLGAHATITYAPLTDGSVYTKETDAVYPHRDIQGPMYVVSEHAVSNGLGGMATTRYAYRGAKGHVTGGGFLGFREVSVTDPAGLVATSTFNQTYDGTEGTVASSQTVAAGVVVTSSSNTYTVQNHGNGRAFAELLGSTASSYELNTGLLATQITTSYGYDTLGCPTAVAVSFNDGHAKTTTNTYNNDQANWLLCQLTRAEVLSQEPGGGSSTRVSSWTYDGVGRIATEVIEPDLPQFTLTTGYTYDAFGNRLSQTTSGAGIETRTTSQTYDAQGRFVVSTTNALGHTETYVRDPAHGGLLSQTGPNGLTTTWSYDGLGRKLGETRADGTTSTITYALAGSGYSITNQTSGAASSTVFYDILERTISTATEGFDGTLIYQDTQYDTLGRVAQTSSPYFSGATPNWSVPAYDALGRVTSVTTPGNRTTTTTYDGLTTTVTNPLGQTKTAVKNSQDKVTSVTDDAGPLSYQYDAFGNLLQVTDPGGNINAMQYDIRGRKVAMQDPDMGSWTYQYNVLGELVSQTDAKGQTTTMVYDKLGRMESRTTLEGTSSWAYDSGLYSVGKLVQVTGPGPYRQLHTYDSLGRPSAVTTQFEGGSYTTQTTYDAFSRVATTEYPTGFRTRNVYNNTGHLQQILDDNLNALFWQANAVNARGRLTSETFGNGVNTQVEFDPTTGDLARIYSLGGSETLQDLNYLFDAIGNLTSINDARQGLTETFVYDALNRMTSVSGVVAKSFAYDNLGNMTHKSDVGDYTYGENGAGPHAVSSTSGTINATYTYDANGNMEAGNGRQITYTSFNKPQSISANGHTLTLGYDPNHQRIKKTNSSSTTVYIGRYEQVTQGSLNEFKHYIHAGNNLVALYTTRTTGINDTRYFHPDHLNSIDTITDELGNVVERLSYDAYGKRRQANWQDATSSIISLSNRGYTGHKHDDEVGLINMRARLYDPVLGRFVQPDTRIPGPTHSQSYNRYSYCGNNPISHMDPTGHFLKKIFKGVRRALRKVSKFAKRAWRNPYVRLAAAVAASFFTGGAAAAAWGPIAGGAAGGAAFGFVASGGNLRAAFAGAATGAAFGWVGNFDLQGFEKIGAHALTGGITSEATGGDFRSGFFGAGVAAFARTNWSIPAKVTLRAVAGGIGAELAGGKFRNGATTAAFAYLFNETLHDKFGELSYSKRRAKWEEFMEKRDEIVAGWNKPHFSSPSLSRKFRGFVKFLLKNGTAYQDWDSERFKYDLGVDSLEAHRVLSGFNERPSTFGPAWAQVRWRLYDFGGSTQDTVDFYYWANEKTRPSNCFFAWNC